MMRLNEKVSASRSFSLNLVPTSRALIKSYLKSKNTVRKKPSQKILQFIILPKILDLNSKTFPRQKKMKLPTLFHKGLSKQAISQPFNKVSLGKSTGKNEEILFLRLHRLIASLLQLNSRQAPKHLISNL